VAKAHRQQKLLPAGKNVMGRGKGYLPQAIFRVDCRCAE